MINDRHLCVGCGLCEGMCPQNAILIRENRDGSHYSINADKCISCGICRNLCPVDRLADIDELSAIRSVWVGKSKDRETVKTSASGGIVTEILRYLFQNKMIDAAIVVFYDEHARLYGDVICSEDEVEKHAGAYYHTSRQLLNVKKINKKKRVAVVGLPCHIEGIINYCRFTGQEGKVIRIALFCTIGRTYAGFRWFIRSRSGLDVKKQTIRNYTSRLGERKLIRIMEENGQVFECPDEEYKFSTDFFWENRSCLHCRKLFGTGADLSVGDAWHRIRVKDGAKEKLAIVSVNSQRGEDLWTGVKERLNVEQTDNPIEELFRSQKYGTGLKIQHDLRLIKGLDRIRHLKDIGRNPILSRIAYRIRGHELKKLERSTEIVLAETREDKIGK